MQPDEQKPHEQRMEQWIDAALRQYGQTEARPGLEERVSARLRAETRMKDQQRQWWVLAGSLAAAVVMAALWLGRSAPERTGSKPVVTNSAAVRAPGALGSKTVELPPRASGGGTRQVRSRRADHSGLTVVARPLPRLQEFPSRETSEQYKLLAAYVERTPRDELKAVIAQQKSSRDVEIKELEIAPLNDAGTAVESEERN